MNLIASPERIQDIKALALDLPSLTLGDRQISDLEMLLSGAFAPLDGYLDHKNYQSVVHELRLQSGALWPIPMTLDVTAKFAESLALGDQIALRDGEGLLLALLTLEERWEPDKQEEAEQVFGTSDLKHPGVEQLINGTGSVYLAGKLEGVEIPLHYSFDELWHSPEAVRKQIADNGWQRVIAFQTSRVIHRVQRDMLLEKAAQYDAQLLIHPTLGRTRAGDIDGATRVHAYEAVMSEFPSDLAMLALSPLAMRQAGPREALWHGLIEQNYGASHFLIGPNDSSPRDRSGNSTFYQPYEAHEFVRRYEQELTIKMLCLDERVYDTKQQRYIAVGEVKESDKAHPFREEALNTAMVQRQPLPEWWSFPGVVNALKKVNRPRVKQGFTLFFTGLSGSGKSTVANIVNARLIEEGSRPVTLLDGDIVRLNLSNELGFSHAHRDINVRRIGFVANEITKNGGVAICAPIAPYTASRRYGRSLIEPNGGYIEVFVSTPLETCEARDRKGLYAKARQGIIPEFTGVSDPYEVPENPEITIDTTELTPLAAAEQVWAYLLHAGYIEAD